MVPKKESYRTIPNICFYLTFSSLVFLVYSFPLLFLFISFSDFLCNFSPCWLPPFAFIFLMQNWLKLDHLSFFLVTSYSQWYWKSYSSLCRNSMNRGRHLLPKKKQELGLVIIDNNSSGNNRVVVIPRWVSSTPFRFPFCLPVLLF